MFASVLIIFLRIIIIIENGRSQMQKLYKITKRAARGEVMKCKHLSSVWLFIISYGLVALKYFFLFSLFFISLSLFFFVAIVLMLSLTSLIHLAAK